MIEFIIRLYSTINIFEHKQLSYEYGKFELMKLLQIEIPDDLNLVEFDLKMSMASKLYDLGKISLGQGAKIVGLSKRAFMELLGEFGVSVFGYTEEELENDLNNV